MAPSSSHCADNGPTQFHSRTCPPLSDKPAPRWCSPSPISCCEHSLLKTKQNKTKHVVHMSTDYLQVLPVPLNFTGKELTQGLECSSAPHHTSHGTALNCLGKMGPVVTRLSPPPASAGTWRAPTHFSVFQGKIHSRWKVLSAKILILMGSVNISLISNPTENGPVILKFTPLPYSFLLLYLCQHALNELVSKNSISIRRSHWEGGRNSPCFH